MTTRIAKPPMPAALSSEGLVALRQHRRSRAARYQVVPSSARFGAVLVFVVMTLVAIGVAITLLALDASAPVAVGAGTLIALAGVGMAALIWSSNRPFREGRYGHVALRSALPGFVDVLARELGGASGARTDLESTIAFLDAQGMAGVPVAVLESLHMQRPERYRVEGRIDGRPVAVEAVIGVPATRPAANERAGGHLFVLAAGAGPAAHLEQRADIHDFEVYAAFGGTVLVRSLAAGLPAPQIVVEAVRRLEPWQPPRAFPAEPRVGSLARATAVEALEAFLVALRDRRYGDAMRLADARLGHGQWLELTESVLQHIVETASVVPHAWSVTKVDADSTSAVVTLRIRFADRRELEVEAQLELDGEAWCVWYFAGLGFHRVDPTNRMS